MSGTGTWWIDGSIAAAALFAAWATIWRRGLKPVFHAVRVLSDAVPAFVDLPKTLTAQNVAAAGDRNVMAAHIIEDREAFANIGIQLQNIQAGQAPHAG